MTTTYTRLERDTYERARERKGRDRADIAAQIADDAEAMIRAAAKANGIAMPNGDKAENLVMAVFCAVMDAAT